MSNNNWPEWDPVRMLNLKGVVVQSIPCQYMMMGHAVRSWFARSTGYQKYAPCGAQALLFQYPEPYGFRSKCEEGHVCIFGAKSIPGLKQELRGATD